MILDMLREMEDRNTKLAGCLEHGDIAQALIYQAQMKSLILAAAVAVLRDEARLTTRWRDRGSDEVVAPG
jgi:hypothetical protein